MKTNSLLSRLLGGAVVLATALSARADVVFETTSVYHHIQVLDQDGVRILSFDGSQESRMSLRDPLNGHFEYTEYFQMPWLWNPRMTNVLMVGLGGGSTQRLYEHYYPGVHIETVEIDPAILRVATNFFHLKLTPRQEVHLEDGRVFLRRSPAKYDAILMDAYTGNRYGSFIPQHLVTKEFFQIAAAHLTTNGVLAYNVIGNLRGWRADLMGAMYKTLKTVFPQVYLFPARTSQNIVLIATKSAEPVTLPELQRRADTLIREGRVTLPTFRRRLYSFQTNAPPTAANAPILTDDFAPVEGLMGATGPTTGSRGSGQ